MPKDIRLNTVNVIEIPDSNDMAVSQLKAFPDNAEGNAGAEKLFKALVAENAETISDADLENACEEGYWEEGTYYVCLVHSSKT